MLSQMIDITEASNCGAYGFKRIINWWGGVNHASGVQVGAVKLCLELGIMKFINPGVFSGTHRPFFPPNFLAPL